LFPFKAPTSQTKGIACGKLQKALQGAGLWLPNLPRFRRSSRRSSSIPLKFKPSPNRARRQGAEMVHFGAMPVGVVEIRDGLPLYAPSPLRINTPLTGPPALISFS